MSSQDEDEPARHPLWEISWIKDPSIYLSFIMVSLGCVGIHILMYLIPIFFKARSSMYRMKRVMKNKKEKTDEL